MAPSEEANARALCSARSARLRLRRRSLARTTAAASWASSVAIGSPLVRVLTSLSGCSVQHFALVRGAMLKNVVSQFRKRENCGDRAHEHLVCF